MAKRLILGKKGSDYGLFVSDPGTNVDSITNVKDFAFTTSDSGYKGNFLMQKNINENNHNFYSQVSREKAQELMVNSSHCLLSIGNKNPNQIPSKVVEYCPKMNLL